MKQALLSRNIHLQPDEHIVAVVRKHWFILLRDSIAVVLIAALPIILIIPFAPSIPANPEVITFLTALWLLAIWMMLATIWTNYYLDMWIVTDKRIVNIDQIHLFKRDISTLRIERVQDVKVETHGLFATLLHFGNLQVQTAGPEASFYMIRGIPNPSQVRNAILEHVDMATEHKNNYAFNIEQRPSESE
ncbi:MAG: PH domain-containing protein [bacterium]|nr:PH domain-containing protein [bacterium]